MAEVAFDSEDYNGPCSLCGSTKFFLFSEEIGVDHCECAECGGVFYVGD